jgi:hypothetical protein
MSKNNHQSIISTGLFECLPVDIILCICFFLQNYRSTINLLIVSKFFNRIREQILKQMFNFKLRMNEILHSKYFHLFTNLCVTKINCCEQMKVIYEHGFNVYGSSECILPANLKKLTINNFDSSGKYHFNALMKNVTNLRCIVFGCSFYESIREINIPKTVTKLIHYNYCTPPNNYLHEGITHFKLNNYCPPRRAVRYGNSKDNSKDNSIRLPSTLIHLNISGGYQICLADFEFLTNLKILEVWNAYELIKYLPIIPRSVEKIIIREPSYFYTGMGICTTINEEFTISVIKQIPKTIKQCLLRYKK